VWGANRIACTPQHQHEGSTALINRVDLTDQITVIIGSIILLTLGRTAG
jgi:hypothetical protein